VHKAKQLAVGYSTGKIGLWDIEQASVVGLLKGHKCVFLSCMVSLRSGSLTYVLPYNM
jgi:hypothetical protein